jgi:hypothetical protein
MNQLWGVYTIDRVENNQKYDNRMDFFLRRAFLGFKGTITEDLSYSIMFQYNNVGLDPHTATSKYNNVGYFPQNQNNQQFQPFDINFTYALHKNWANITVGYFRPQVGREHISFLDSISFEKTLANFYPRLHLVGTLPGRELGINLGGLYNDEKGKWGIDYRFGVFNPDKMGGSSPGYTGGDSLLYTARIALSLGDPEFKKYALVPKLNYFGKRNGITFAANYAYQGRGKDSSNLALNPVNVSFKNNQMIGFDILANYKNFIFNAEYDILKRNYDNSSLNYSDKVWHVRTAYDFRLPNKTILQPAFAYEEWQGDEKSIYGNGNYKVTDVGVNWYIKPGFIKLNLHYVKQAGTPKSFYSPNATSHDGNYIGVGLELIY